MPPIGHATVTALAGSASPRHGQTAVGRRQLVFWAPHLCRHPPNLKGRCADSRLVAALGHNRTFPTSSKFLRRRTCEWQVSGDASEPLFGSTRPGKVLREGLLWPPRLRERPDGAVHNQLRKNTLPVSFLPRTGNNNRRAIRGTEVHPGRACVANIAMASSERMNVVTICPQALGDRRQSIHLGMFHCEVRR